VWTVGKKGEATPKGAKKSLGGPVKGSEGESLDMKEKAIGSRGTGSFCCPRQKAMKSEAFVKKNESNQMGLAKGGRVRGKFCNNRRS